jgi:hypothetical protein
LIEKPAEKATVMLGERHGRTRRGVAGRAIQARAINSDESESEKSGHADTDEAALTDIE